MSNNKEWYEKFNSRIEDIAEWLQTDLRYIISNDEEYQFMEGQLAQSLRNWSSISLSEESIDNLKGE